MPGGTLVGLRLTVQTAWEIGIGCDLAEIVKECVHVVAVVAGDGGVMAGREKHPHDIGRANVGIDERPMADPFRQGSPAILRPVIPIGAPVEEGIIS